MGTVELSFCTFVPSVSDCSKPKCPLTRAYAWCVVMLCCVDKTSLSHDDDVSAPSPVSILTNRTMDFVHRNSYGDLSMSLLHRNNYRSFLLLNIYEYSHSSFTNRCTFIKTLIKIYIKVMWLLHVLVYDHHQGACDWAWLKLYWYEKIQYGYVVNC
jgi:hypothetical protein